MQFRSCDRCGGLTSWPTVCGYCAFAYGERRPCSACGVPTTFLAFCGLCTALAAGVDVRAAA